MPAQWYSNQMNCGTCVRALRSASSSEDLSLGSSFAARRGNGTNRLFSELDASSGFQKPYSSDEMIDGAMKSFWYVYIIN